MGMWDLSEREAKEIQEVKEVREKSDLLRTKRTSRDSRSGLRILHFLYVLYFLRFSDSSRLRASDGQRDCVVDDRPICGRGLQYVADRFFMGAGGDSALAYVVRSIA
jgi:hypothetical protein